MIISTRSGIFKMACVMWREDQQALGFCAKPLGDIVKWALEAKINTGLGRGRGLNAGAVGQEEPCPAALFFGTRMCFRSFISSAGADWKGCPSSCLKRELSKRDHVFELEPRIPSSGLRRSGASFSGGQGARTGLHGRLIRRPPRR